MITKTKIEDFKKTAFGQVIEAEGTFNSQEMNVNLSSILTILIQEAGRWCISYASDLFIYWQSMLEKMSLEELKSDSMLFGFRERGIDNALSIFHKYERDRIVTSYEYRAIWRLDVAVTEHEYGYKARFTLYPVDR